MIDFPTSDASDRAPRDGFIDRIDTSQPIVRDLRTLIAAAYILEAEFRYQHTRLGPEPTGRTEVETTHKRGLTEQYKVGASTIRTYRRYQEDRLERQRKAQDPGAPPPNLFLDPAIVFGKQDDPDA